MLLIVGGYVSCMILEINNFRKADLTLFLSSRLSLAIVERNHMIEKLFNLSNM